MSYRNRTIKVLSKKEIEERYPKENNSNMAKLTREFVQRGFKIVRLKMDGLCNEKFLTMEVNDAGEQMQKLKGLWIPAEILLNEGLSDKEKIILAIILYLGEETKRFFETAYKFVVEYKDLGEQYIISAKVHRDEQTPHMHLIFLPVVHTTDKKGNDIEKLACSEFWKAKDSYRQLQDAFYKYMVENGFDLQRGLPKEETNRQHYCVEEYKKITNFI